MVKKIEASRFAEEKKPCQGDTIGDLVDYLSQFPRDWSISIHDWKGDIRRHHRLEDHHIATVLTSYGEIVEP